MQNQQADARRDDRVGEVPARSKHHYARRNGASEAEHIAHHVKPRAARVEVVLVPPPRISTQAEAASARSPAKATASMGPPSIFGGFPMRRKAFIVRRMM